MVYFLKVRVLFIYLWTLRWAETYYAFNTDSININPTFYRRRVTKKKVGLLPPLLNLQKDNGLSTTEKNSADIKVNDIMNNAKNKDQRLRYRARVSYDGTSFKGWQVQANGRTVQGDIEKTLSRRFNRSVKIVGAGRTDAGVHARGQAFHFDIYPEEVYVKKDYQKKYAQYDTVKDDDYDDEDGVYSDMDRSDESKQMTRNLNDQFCKLLQTSLNKMLPEDIRIWNISQCPPPITVTRSFDHGGESTMTYKWHVIYNCKQKLYVYRISIGPNSISTDPLERYTRVHVEGDIDANYLQNVLKHYEGTHDFRAFAGAIEANQRKDGIEHKNTVRTVYNVTLVDEGGGRYRIEILLKGALYKMVRNMVGTALDVCKGRVDEARLLRMLHHWCDDDNVDGDSKPKQFVRKDNKCKPAPPEGLELARVDFDDEW